MIEQLPAGRPRPLAVRSRHGARAGVATALVGLAAFAILAGLVTWRWLALVGDPPASRGVAAVAAGVVGAVLLSAVAHGSRRPRVRTAAGIAIAIATIIAGAIAMGVPVRLLAPAGWGELARGVGGGFSGALGGTYPYIGDDTWTRLVILCAAPVVVGLGAWLGFGPGSDRRSRTWPVVALVAGFGIAISMTPPSDPATAGLALFGGIAAWLWAGRIAEGGVAAGAFLVAGAVLALPLASALDRDDPLLDYRSWNASDAATQSVTYTWDHTYGPLHWSRTGRTLMTITGSSPQYWRTEVLERFDGLRWMAASGSVSARFEIPEPAARALTTEGRIAALDPRWIHRPTFTIDALSSPLVVAPGAALRIGDLTIASAGPAGLALPGDESLGGGDSYSVVAYEPDPSPAELRRAPHRLDAGLRRYTEIALPTIQPGPAPTDRFGRPLQLGLRPPPTVGLRTIETPLYGSTGGERDRRLLAASSYAPVYALARRLTKGTTTEYGAVNAIERHLRGAYAYSETPPRRELPLRAFLFRDRAGYCQQFSGAMALMLRTIGIPARVATGFTPGIHNPNGPGLIVRDLDAHSWVEVYFNGIGWVPFDPTPAAAPAAAQSRAPGLGTSRQQRRQLAGQRGGPAPVQRRLLGRATGGDGPPLLLIIAIAGAGGAAAWGASVLRRRRRFLALPPGDGASAQARELDGLVRRLGFERHDGVTLLELERRLATIAGPEAGEYPRALRSTRFARDGGAPPTLRDRRGLRRALYGRGRSRRWLAGLRAIPPGGPR